MRNDKLARLVDLVIKLDQDVIEKQAMLKCLKADLVEEARARKDEQQPIADGGRSITFPGTDGSIARVTFPKPALKSSISAGTTLDKIRAMVTDHQFKYLFERQPKFKPTIPFRAMASRMLDAKTVTKLTRLCTTASTPRVSFETKDTNKE